MEHPVLKSYATALLSTTGAEQTIDATGHATLSAGTYYYPLGLDAAGINFLQRATNPVRQATLEGIGVQWDSAAIMVITFEDTPFPDVSVISTTAGDWTQENPSTAYVAVTGGTVASMTVTVAGGTAGSCTFHVGNFGLPRARLKIVVTTAGLVRVGQHGKS